MPARQPFPQDLPLVGRSDELGTLREALDAAEAGRGRMVLLAGAGGTGKSRLAAAAVETAEKRGFRTALGRAYPVEAGVPFALFSDALIPLLRALGDDTLAVLTRGHAGELADVFPGFAEGEPARRPPQAGGPEARTRVFWHLTSFLDRLASRRPVLLVLEDVQWADASSLELLHFLARQLREQRALLVCTYNDEVAPTQGASGALRSLAGLQEATLVRLGPLSRAECAELVTRAFGEEPVRTRDFSTLLYGWTRGNPYFLAETLRSLVETGVLSRQGERWEGWEIEELALPHTIRDALGARLSRLGKDARGVAEVASVAGHPIPHQVLGRVAGIGEDALARGMEELVREGIALERVEGHAVVYDFTHPLLRETLYAGLGLARARLLHARLAEALEAEHGSAAGEHAGEIAYHFQRARSPELAPRAFRHLVAAGRSALGRNADREAAAHLGAALDLADAGRVSADQEVVERVVEELARARQRLGEFEEAEALWRRALASALGDHDRAAAIHRRLGLIRHWRGRPSESLAEYDAGLALVRDPATAARLRLARGAALQEMGRSAEAARELAGAQELTESVGDRSLLARVYRAQLLLHVFTGPPEEARRLGERALGLAREAGAEDLACGAQWALAVLAGLTGDRSAGEHIAESRRLAEEIHSPVLQVWAAEVAIEYASATGRWDEALALGERTIVLARSLSQRTLLPRLLVWTGLLYIARDDMERGRAYVREAWELSGAGGAGGRDVHTVVPAHTGMCAWHVAREEWDEAIRVGEAGLAVADRTGYTVWAIHRLLPILGEAYAMKGDLDAVRVIAERIRQDSERLGHKLGLAWAAAAEAVLEWRTGQLEPAIRLLRSAAEELEGVPFIPDAARLRRQLAARLRDAGRREEAVSELRRIHDVFLELGAVRELEKTREQLRELGARPPARTAGAGAEALTERELEIAELAIAGKSNKAIGKTLGISPRTAGTHLSNIFRKLEVGSREELAEAAREGRLPLTLA